MGSARVEESKGNRPILLFEMGAGNGMFLGYSLQPHTNRALEMLGTGRRVVRRERNQLIHGTLHSARRIDLGHTLLLRSRNSTQALHHTMDDRSIRLDVNVELIKNIAPCMSE